MDGGSFLCQFKYAVVLPTLWCPENKHRSFRVPCKDSQSLTLSDVEALNPDVVVDHGRIDGCEVLHNLQRNKPRIH